MANLQNTEARKAASHTVHESAAGVRMAPGPFIGIVKGNTDPLRSGKLQVWIPELGGDPEDDSSWRSVSYCTPFYGVTDKVEGADFASAPHSYGMWFTPPDLETKVMCMFVNGDPARGYYFACVPEWPSLHMLPAISASVDKSSPDPVVEYYDNGGDPSALASVHTLKKASHDIQKQIWSTQGLLQDPDRGPGTSSAFRETPSSVFGISTPGQPIQQNVEQNQPDPTDGSGQGPDPVTYSSQTKGRRGGHTFVMDDGDAQGNNRMFRLRSSNGHMILMNDTKDFMYIINSKGTAWVELNGQGDVNVYSGAQVNMYAQAGINLDSKAGIKIHGASVDIKSDAAVNIEGKDVNIKGGGTTKISGAMGLHLKGMNTYLTGDKCLQVASGGVINVKGSCTTIQTTMATKAMDAGGAMMPMQMPTKEPWTGHKGTNGGGSGGVANPAAQPTYGATNGQPDGAAGDFGATNNFGSGMTPQSYGSMTNDIGPVTYNNGQQGSFEGQSSTTAQSSSNDASQAAAAASDAGNLGTSAGTGALRDSAIPDATGQTGGNAGSNINTTAPANNNGNSGQGSNFGFGKVVNSVVNGVATATIKAAVNNLLSSGQSYNTSNPQYPKTQNYSTMNNLQNVSYGSGASFDVGLKTQSAADKAKYSAGELQNNPGNLQYGPDDKYAVGFANSLAIYAKPEQGIAAFISLFDSYYSGDKMTCIQLISRYLQANVTDNNVKSLARFTQNLVGIAPNDYVNLKEGKTRVAFISAMIKFVQGRIIYTYNQILSGCALSLGVAPTDLIQSIAPTTKPWQNGSGQFGFGGYSPVYSSGAQKGSSSLLDVVKNAAISTVVNKVTGLATGYVNNAVNNIFSGGTSNGGSISVSGGTNGSGSWSASASYSTENNGVNNSNPSSVYSGSVPNPQLMGQVVGNGQCAVFVQNVAPECGLTNTWRPASSQNIFDNPPPPGAAIATLDKGGYANQPTGNHAAIYLDQGQDDRGRYILVQDQNWPHGSGVTTHKIYEQPGKSDSNNALTYRQIANDKNPNGIVSRDADRAQKPNPDADKNTQEANKKEDPNDPMVRDPVSGETMKKSQLDQIEANRAKVATDPADARDLNPEKKEGQPEGTPAQKVEEEKGAVKVDQPAQKSVDEINTKIESEKVIQSQAEEKQAQGADLRAQQADVRAKQEAVQEQYDTGKIDANTYKTQTASLTSQNQSLGNQARKLENEATTDLAASKERETALVAEKQTVVAQNDTGTIKTYEGEVDPTTGLPPATDKTTTSGQTETVAVDYTPPIDTRPATSVGTGNQTVNSQTEITSRNTNYIPENANDIKYAYPGSAGQGDTIIATDVPVTGGQKVTSLGQEGLTVVTTNSQGGLVSVAVVNNGTKTVTTYDSTGKASSYKVDDVKIENGAPVATNRSNNVVSYDGDGNKTVTTSDNRGNSNSVTTDPSGRVIGSSSSSVSTNSDGSQNISVSSSSSSVKVYDGNGKEIAQNNADNNSNNVSTNINTPAPGFRSEAASDASGAPVSRTISQSNPDGSVVTTTQVSAPPGSSVNASSSVTYTDSNGNTVTKTTVDNGNGPVTNTTVTPAGGAVDGDGNTIGNGGGGSSSQASSVSSDNSNSGGSGARADQTDVQRNAAGSDAGFGPPVSGNTPPPGAQGSNSGSPNAPGSMMMGDQNGKAAC
jgi:hypothetical protein